MDTSLAVSMSRGHGSRQAGLADTAAVDYQNRFRPKEGEGLFVGDGSSRYCCEAITSRTRSAYSSTIVAGSRSLIVASLNKSVRVREL